MPGSTNATSSVFPRQDKDEWWQGRRFVLAAALIAVIPLLWPAFPPLIDLPAHMGRYRVQQSIAQAPWLGEWYQFEWALIGNLGVDLLIALIEPWLGLEAATKLVVILIPALTVIGLLRIAREVHGKIPATTLFALPLAYAFPFHFGFVNFALSMALALNAFAFWLALERSGHRVARAIVFVPLSFILWVAHVYGWAVLGLLVAATETMRSRQRGETWFTSLWQAGSQCLALAGPVLLMIAWQGQQTGTRTEWFRPIFKLQWMISIFRDRWQILDLASAFVVYALLFAGIRSPGLSYAPRLGAAAIVLGAFFLLLPFILLGSAYADMRLAPYAIAIGLVALRPEDYLTRRQIRLVAFAGLAFLTIRMGATAASFYLYDQSFRRELAALDHLPIGSKVAGFSGFGCGDDWTTSRFEHLPSMALVRRLAFANDQWELPGAQLMQVKRREAVGFRTDPSQLVVARQCEDERWLTLDQTLAALPRDAFTHVWLIDPPPHDRGLTHGLTPVWRDGTSVLFATDPASASAERVRTTVSSSSRLPENAGTP